MKPWFKISNEDNLLTPALLFYPERIRQNIDQMIRIAGKPERMRPHVKTYKCPEIVQMQMERGVSKFKCATISEAKMLAKYEVPDILIAYPLVGPAQKGLVRMIQEFPESKFSVLIDHIDQLRQWDQHEVSMNLFIDLDVGMHRTGINLAEAASLYEAIQDSTHRFIGWHIYDGHIHHSDLTERTKAVNKAYSELEGLIHRTGTEEAELICGSSVTFPIHAAHQNRMLAPGTTLLWDHGYASQFPDLTFDIAATMLTRIVSKPGRNLLCLDLGYKAVASEMDSSPVIFPEVPDGEIVNHSEEHMVIATKESDKWKIGDCAYALPWHICPTVALHEQAAIVSNQSANEFWKIESRNRIYTHAG